MKELNWFQRWYRIFALTVFYTTFYDEENGGYLVRKRRWVFLLLTPIILPFFMLRSILDYYDWVITYYMHWIRCKKQKLTFWQKIEIKDRLCD